VNAGERFLRALDNPIVAKDGISRMRSWRAPLAITLYLGLLGAFGFGIFSLEVLSSSLNRPVSAEIGAAVFGALAWFQLVLICLFAPALASAAISGERERQTFDVLLVSGVSAFGIVWGKLVASLAYMFLLIVSALPLFAAVFLFGGVDLEQFILVQLVTVVTASSIGAVSLFCSALFRRTLTSTVSSYGACFALVGGTAVAGIILSYLKSFGQGGSALEWHPLLFANPFFALNATLTQPSGAAIHLGRLLQLLVLARGQPSDWGPAVEPWQLSVLAELVLGALAIAASVLLVRGRRASLPLRQRRQPAPAQAAS
jgi:ABC-type transport system involved in multi-copper enzyme maturation permease subunit